MDSDPGLFRIARELRDTIYDMLAEEEDMSSLMHTSRKLRSEVLDRMPGADSIDYTNPGCDKDLQSVDVSRLNIIAEPWCSPGSALKVEVEWMPKGLECNPRATPIARGLDTKPGVPPPPNSLRTCGRRPKISRWTIRDLSSPMARYILLYRPRSVTVTFIADNKGCFFLAPVILRAKLFDICRLLIKVYRVKALRGPEPRLNIYFQGEKDPNRHPTSRKSFRVMRPRYLRSLAETDYDRTIPYFYECLMLPLFTCHALAPEKRLL
jgi:hypothetical protein